MGIETAIIASSAISAGAGMASASKAAKAAGKAPPKRSYLGEMQEALSSQRQIMPEYLALQREFNPQFQSLQRDTLMGQIGTLGDVYGAAIPMGARLASQGTAAMAPVLSQIGTSAKDAYNTMLGQNAFNIMNTMERQANEELSLGRSLSDEERMYGEQSARAAMQARGLQGGNQAIAQEVLNNYNLGMGREAQRRAYAGQVYGMSQNTAGNAYNMYGQPLTQMIAGFSPTGMYGQASAASAEYADRFNPESQYMSDVQGGNIQNQMNAQLASAQARAGMGAGLMSLSGNIAGSYLGNPGLFNNRTAATTQGLPLNQVTSTLSTGLQNSSLGQAGMTTWNAMTRGFGG